MRNCVIRKRVTSFSPPRFIFIFKALQLLTVTEVRFVFVSFFAFAAFTLPSELSSTVSSSHHGHVALVRTASFSIDHFLSFETCFTSLSKKYTEETSVVPVRVNIFQQPLVFSVDIALEGLKQQI